QDERQYADARENRAGRRQLGDAVACGERQHAGRHSAPTSARASTGSSAALARPSRASYNSLVPSIDRFHDSVATYSRPSAPSRPRSGPSFASVASAAPNAAGVDSTRNPALPSASSSSTPPTRVDTTGRPTAAA